MKRPTTASRRSLERGQFSWVTLVLFLGVGATFYFGWVWVPVLMTHQRVKSVVHEHINLAVHDRNDANVVKRMCLMLEGVDNQLERDENGRATTVPAVVVAPEDVVWERDTEVTPPMLHVEFEYVRRITYPLVDRTEDVTMRIDISGDIGVPNWGK